MKFFWYIVCFFAICIGLFGFFLVSITMSIGYGLTCLGSGLGNLYDWYVILFMKTLKFIKQQLE